MRERWIDLLKGIGITLVCLGHLSPDIFTEMHIYSFHMPLFFFISGYLFLNSKKVNFNEFTIKKISGLIKPYLFFGVVSILVGVILRIVSIADFRNNISNLLFLNGTVGWNSPIWFLVVLFLCEIIYYLIYNNMKFKSVNVGIILIGFLGYIIQLRKIILPFGLHIAPIGLTFFHIGLLFKKFDITSLLLRYKVIIIALSMILNILFGYVMNIRISVYHQNYGNYIYFYIAAIAGIILYSTIALTIKENKIIELFGRNTLLILTTQYMLFREFMILEAKVGIKLMYTQNLFVSFTLTFITLALYYLIIKLYNNYMSKYTKVFNKVISQ